MRKAFLFCAFFAVINEGKAQCCSAGSGSPIAGGTSQGVLQERQAEVNLNYQHASSKKFLKGDKPVDKFLDYFGYDFTYLRLSYGITERLTLSLENGYYINKKEKGLDGGEMIQSTGLSDVVIFPRYKLYGHNGENTRDEIVMGLGYKIPVGKYNDSLKQVESFSGEEYYITKPPGIQPTTGSQDFIFYLFAYRGYPEKNFRLFANSVYIKKGWNPLGLKYGDYASISVFAGKTFFNKLGATLQVKGEWIDEMKFNTTLQKLAYYNFDVHATGMKLVSVIPQLSYSFGNLTIYGLKEFPIYQYVTKTQVAADNLFTFGLSYRFLTYRESETE